MCVHTHILRYLVMDNMLVRGRFLAWRMLMGQHTFKSLEIILWGPHFMSRFHTKLHVNLASSCKVVGPKCWQVVRPIPTDWLTDNTTILLGVWCATSPESIRGMTDSWETGHAVAENLSSGFEAGLNDGSGGFLWDWLTINHDSIMWSHMETHTACQSCYSRVHSSILRWSVM